MGLIQTAQRNQQIGDDPIFTAHLGSNHGDGPDLGITCILRKAVKAGIDGPCGTITGCKTLGEVERAINAEGFHVSGWELVVTYAGMQMEALLTPLTPKGR